MTYENLTTFTEYDPNIKWFQTITRNTFDTLLDNEAGYVYKDYGIDYFGYNFIYNLDLNITANTLEWGENMAIGFWAVTNNYGNMYDFSYSHGGLAGTLMAYVVFTGYYSTTQYELRIKEYLESGVNYDKSRYFDTDTVYYLKIIRDSTSFQLKIYPTTVDRQNDTNIIDTLSLTLQINDTFRYLQCGVGSDGDLWNEDNNISGYVENFNLSIPPIELELIDILSLSDAIAITNASTWAIIDDNFTISDDLFVNIPVENVKINESLNITDSLETILYYHEKYDIVNAFSMVYTGDLKNIENDFRYVTEPTYDITNDFRMLKQWQVPGDAGFQSLGKEHIKIYINGSADDDVDINSITINKVLNASHTANFVIGRPYDTANKPTIEHIVEIRYYETNWSDYWVLYKGYITQINPGDEPDTIKINCQDKYWFRNREKKYFFVGHEPSDNQELYYETILEGLLVCEFNITGIGNFVPQTINLFGRGESDCISELITNSGNYAWFYDIDGTKKLWIADRGSIINLERQEIGKNIGLYQVLKHSFTESGENLTNRFRVTMGDKIIRRFNNYGGSKEYDGYYYYLDLALDLTPAWDSSLETLARYSDEEEGFDRHPTDKNSLYANVYTKYTFPFTSTDLEAYTDRFEPRIVIEAPIDSEEMKCSIGVRRGSIRDKILQTAITGGFTVDYKNHSITFGERVFLYTEDKNGEMDSTSVPIMRLTIWKQRFISKTDTPTDNPEDPEDITSPLVFITDKMGDYDKTIWSSLQLSGLGIQYGGWYISRYDETDNAIWQYVPSWDDTAFAKDYANWKLSQNCDKKIQGTIDLTIDAICYYNIDLTKRIMIEGVLENPLNINSMTYNFNNFTVTLSLENERYFKRSISIQPRGI